MQAAATANFDTFDPHLSVGTSLAYYPRVYNVLIHQSSVKPDFVFMDMAESFEHPDETTYVFKMRQGVKIAPNTLDVPGRNLDAEDARVTFERMSTEPRSTQGAFVKQQSVSWEVQDPQTFVLKTKDPYAWFLSRVGSFVGTIPPRELIQNKIDMTKQGVGAGPFKPVRFVEGEGASFDRNPSYYRKDERTGEQLPYIDGIDVRIIPDRSARRTAFLSKQTYAYVPENIDEANQLLAGDPDIYLLKEPNFSFVSFTMNPTRDPWKDDRIRRAASYALNRQQFIDIIAKGDAQPNGVVHWPTGPYSFSKEELETKYQPFDAARARQLIREATGQDTLRIKVMYPTLDPMPQYLPIFLEQYKAAGFEIDQDPQDFTTWLGNYRTVNYDASLSLNLPYETPETPLNFHASGGPSADKSFAIGIGVIYPEVDEAVQQAHHTTDPEALVRAVLDAQKLIYERAPAMLHIYSTYSNNLFWSFVKNHPLRLGIGVSWLLVNDWWLEGL